MLIDKPCWITELERDLKLLGWYEHAITKITTVLQEHLDV